MKLVCDIIVTLILVKIVYNFLVPRSVRQMFSKVGKFSIMQLEKQVVLWCESRVVTEDEPISEKPVKEQAKKTSDYIRIVK